MATGQVCPLVMVDVAAPQTDRQLFPCFIANQRQDGAAGADTVTCKVHGCRRMVVLLKTKI